MSYGVRGAHGQGVRLSESPRSGMGKVNLPPILLYFSPQYSPDGKQIAFTLSHRMTLFS